MILPQDVLDDCFELAGIGRLAAAEELTEQAVRHYSTDGGLRQLQGFLRHRLGDFPGARGSLESAARLAPLEPLSRCILAECYARTDSAQRAADLYRELADDAHCPTTLLPDVASGLGGLGEYEAALATCRELIRREPGHHQAYFGVAFYLRRLGASPYAILPDVIRAHELAPEVPLYRITLAVLFDTIGWREDAYDLLRDIDPCAVPCRCCLQKAMAIFRDAGDRPRFESFKVQTDLISDGRLAEV